MSSLTETEYFSLFTIIALLMIIGSLLQVFAILVLLKAPFRKLDLSPDLLNVALANAVVIISDFPAVAASAWSQKSILGSLECTMLGFLTGVGFVATFFTMTMSIYRIHRKLEDGRVGLEMVLAEREPWSCHKIIKMFTNTWFCAVILMLPPVFGFGSFGSESGGSICAPNWRDNTIAGRMYMALLVVMAFIIPLTVSIVCFIRIFKWSKQIREVDLVIEMETAKAKKAVFTMLAGIASFVVSWTPYCVCAMITVFGGSEMFDREKSFIPGIFAKCSAVSNPLICLLVSKRFRTEAMKILRCCCKSRESLNADVNLYPLVLIQRMSSVEVNDQTRMRAFRTSSSLSSTPPLEQNVLNRASQIESSV